MSTKLTKAKLKKILEHALKLHKSLDTVEFTSWSITVANMLYDIKNSIEMFCSTNKEMKYFDDVFISCGYKNLAIRYGYIYNGSFTDVDQPFIVKFTNEERTKWQTLMF